MVTAGKFCTTKLLQFRLKGNNLKMKVISGSFGVASTRMITKESTHLEVGILGTVSRLDEEYGD
jgi:hypothetical protein